MAFLSLRRPSIDSKRTCLAQKANAILTGEGDPGRLKALAVVAIAASLRLIGGAAAQEAYPTRTVRLIEKPWIAAVDGFGIGVQSRTMNFNHFLSTFDSMAAPNKRIETLMA
jgi:hypothetical protein